MKTVSLALLALCCTAAEPPLAIYRGAAQRSVSQPLLRASLAQCAIRGTAASLWQGETHLTPWRSVWQPPGFTALPPPTIQEHHRLIFSTENSSTIVVIHL